jgi:hypothetical protein
MGFGIVKGMYVPTHLGIIFPVNPLVRINQSKRGLVGHRVVENFNKGVVHQMNPQVEYVEV